MNREIATATARRIANMAPANISPEEIIDLAEVCCFLLGVEPMEDHAAKDCWLAGNDGHLQCTPPDVCTEQIGLNEVCGQPANAVVHLQPYKLGCHVYAAKKRL